MKHTTATTTQNITPNTVAVCTLATAYFAMFGLRIGIKYVLRMKGLNNAVLTWNICFFFPEWLERIKLLQTEWAVGTEKKSKSYKRRLHNLQLKQVLHTLQGLVNIHEAWNPGNVILSVKITDYFIFNFLDTVHSKWDTLKYILSVMFVLNK